MRSTRIAVPAALLGALALPLASAATASATPAVAPASVTDSTCSKPGLRTLTTKAVTIRAKASDNSKALGILYRGHKFTVHRPSDKRRYTTDETTGVTGWISSTYVHHPADVCLD
ncbi:SH3 domain-containing protein [Streptomyces sp. GbtcB6]|uniref:SH3 domain-containing protein n=1 Tax=Streptomyces sp. GbtcB6 TaxID=2824751 RepID=UPI001C30BE4A|nr:SH3 domain-containing protein [Streptomyces sp. GbtcB6]